MLIIKTARIHWVHLNQVPCVARQFSVGVLQMGLFTSHKQNPACLCSGLSFQGSLYNKSNKQPWKIDMVFHHSKGSDLLTARYKKKKMKFSKIRFSICNKATACVDIAWPLCLCFVGSGAQITSIIADPLATAIAVIVIK